MHIIYSQLKGFNIYDLSFMICGNIFFNGDGNGEDEIKSNYDTTWFGQYEMRVISYNHIGYDVDAARSHYEISFYFSEAKDA